MNALLGQAVLAAHLVVIAFNLFGLFAIPLGAALGWAWVKVRWWRLLHLASLAVVAAQAALGRACFLTDWQDALTGAGRGDPMIMRWVNGVIYWPLPIWVFSAGYLAVFVYVLVLWRIVPPRVPSRREAG
jgi:Protein of Unknown function (DUF2784)